MISVVLGVAVVLLLGLAVVRKVHIFPSSAFVVVLFVFITSLNRDGRKRI